MEDLVKKARCLEAVEQPEIELKDLLDEVGHGEIRLKVVDKKLFLIPKQCIERSQKDGIRVKIFIDHPMRIKIG